MSNGPSVHYLDGTMPFAEATTRVRALGDAFKHLGSCAFRVAHECDPPEWPFTVTFDGYFDSLGTRFDVAITVTLTPREDTPHDPTGPAAPLPLGN